MRRPPIHLRYWVAVSDSPGVNTVPEEVQQEFIKKHAGSFVGSALCFGLSGDRPIYKLLYNNSAMTA